MITIEDAQKIFANAVDSGSIDIGDNSWIFINLDMLEDRVRYYQDVFPENTINTVAVKSNPLNKILQIIAKCGSGLETASFTEVELARNAGVPVDKIIFDSPAKCLDDIKRAMDYGVYINIDNFSEVERIGKLRTDDTQSRFGLRINPQVGHNSIESMSVGNEYSKFGIPINDYRDLIIKTCIDNDWITGLHVHVGSQGMSLENMVDGIGVIYDLALEINNASTTNRITTIDIGGGLPIGYHKDETTPDVRDYVDMLKQRCPKLFTSEFQIINEPGRYIHGTTSWVISRVEYTKHQSNYNTAVIHIGADLFLRECYNPKDWYHRVGCLTSSLQLNSANEVKEYNIAGPLCFGGDIPCRNISLPVIAEGDYVVIFDTGANTFNMWSRHCSRLRPAIIGYRKDETFEVLSKKETIEDLISYWS